jgi:hypothetical protein
MEGVVWQKEDHLHLSELVLERKLGKVPEDAARV